MTSPSNRAAADAADGDESRERALDLSFTKIAGGAAAAVTTAVVASYFGVTGTLTGAAFGSIVSSVAAAIYAASFKTAGTRIRATATVVTRTARRGGDPQDPATVPAELTGRSTALPGEAVVLPAEEGGVTAGTVPPAPQHRTTRPRRSRGRLPGWKPIALLAGFIFVAALAAISTTELFLGHPISDSKDSGTSIGTVVRGGPVVETTDPTESPSESESESPSPSSPTSTDSPSPSDSTSPTDETSQTGDQGGVDGTQQPGEQGQQGEVTPTTEPAPPTDSPAVQPGATAGSPEG